MKKAVYKTNKQEEIWQLHTDQLEDVEMKHQWLVHVTRREGKQHATRATKTIHMKDEIRDEINMAAHWKSSKLCNYN